MEFLKNTQATIDCKNYSICFKNGVTHSLNKKIEERKFQQVAHASFQFGKKALKKMFSIKSPQDVIIPHKSRMVIEGKIKNNVNFTSFRPFLISDSETLHQAGIYLGSTYLGQVEDEKVLIPILNVSNIPLKIQRGERVKTATPIVHSQPINIKKLLVNSIQEQVTCKMVYKATLQELDEKYEAVIEKTKCSKETKVKLRNPTFPI